MRISIIYLFLILINFLNVNAQERVITTGVPFLLITPDARAGGMGELGVASSPDAYAQQWNPAKYAFIESDNGLGLSYTPYLRQLVDDIFLGSLTYFKKINEISTENSFVFNFTSLRILCAELCNRIPLRGALQ
mgnify:CR=1 FL=1